MSTLIYRGHPYSRTKNTPAVSPMSLIYRGAKHDGSASDSAQITSAFEMCYRSIGYWLWPDGTRILEEHSALSHVDGYLQA